MGLFFRGQDPSDDSHIDNRGSLKRFLGLVTEIDWAARLNAGLTTPGSASSDTLAGFSGYRTGTDAQRTALAGARLFDGLMFHAQDTGITWRYFAANAVQGTAAGWRRWFSDWQNFTLAFTQGIISPGYTNRYRYNAGRVEQEFWGTFANVNGTGGFTLGTPVPAAFGKQAPIGTARGRQSGGTTTFEVGMDFASANALTFWTIGAVAPASAYAANTGNYGVGGSFQCNASYWPA
jgi:hypothetical protein